VAVAFGVRSMTADEYPLVYATWLRSYRSGNQIAHKRWHRAYFEEQRALIDRVLADPATRLTCLQVLDDGPRSIVGWLCSSEVLRPRGFSVVHYAYVRAAGYRRRGILRRLLAAAGVTPPVAYTHQTTSGEAVVEHLRASGWSAELLCPQELLV
jgi:hypothetical protein